MPSLAFHSLPPIDSSLSFPTGPYSPFSPPPHNSRTTIIPKAKTTPLHRIIVASASPSKPKTKTKTKTQNQDDDYHATLKALNSKGRFPRKSLGQHYMLNGSINEQLVVAADVKEGDVVLEIGPGTGSLTHFLVNAGATVLAIEKLEIYSRCYKEQPLVIQGAGAGNDTTAAGVLADILDIQDLFPC